LAVDTVFSAQVETARIKPVIESWFYWIAGCIIIKLTTTKTYTN
jgi:hypothetical protein